jgi:two-component system, NarL family, nitrate/nitrite response regulator NarL
LLMRASLRYVLENAEMTLVGEAATSADGLICAGRDRPDIIILDLDTCSAGEVAGLASVRAESRLIALATRGYPHVDQAAIEIGALGLVLKDEPSEVLIKAIRKVYAGEAWFSRRNTAGVLRDPRRTRRPHAEGLEAAKIATLTAREREIISQIGEGLKNRAIAQRLLISEATVRHHLTSILGKLGVSDRFELVVYAFKHRLIDYAAA